MRWASQSVAIDDGALPGLQRFGLVRSVRTPQFDGITFHEVLCKSALNKVPNAAMLPFRYTVNGYRGCSHACRYCFARPTHEYLDLDCGTDFDTQVVVKVNVADVLRRELRRPSWTRETVALGTNTDPYQRAEGRYALMPDIIRALADSHTPFSILTKGTLILRDLKLLRQAAAVTEVQLAVSIGFMDRQLWRSVEPGTPSPQARLGVVRRLSDAGFRVGVLMAPILPGLTDDPRSIEATVAAIADAGAASLTPVPLHLRTGARQWYGQWLSRVRPDLLPRYRELYARGAYTPREYQRVVIARVRRAARRHGLPSGGEEDSGGVSRPLEPTGTDRTGRAHPVPSPAPAQPPLW